jgi:hypothetical protein
MKQKRKPKQKPGRVGSGTTEWNRLADLEFRSPGLTGSSPDIESGTAGAKEWVKSPSQALQGRVPWKVCVSRKGLMECVTALRHRANTMSAASPWRDFRTDPPPSSVKRRQIPILVYLRSGNTWRHPTFGVGIINWSGPRRGWEWSSGWRVKKLPTHWAELTIPENKPPGQMPNP